MTESGLCFLCRVGAGAVWVECRVASVALWVTAMQRLEELGPHAGRLHGTFRVCVLTVKSLVWSELQTSNPVPQLPPGNVSVPLGGRCL